MVERQRLDSEGEAVTSGFDKTLFTDLHTCDVSHHVTRIRPFSKWPSIKRQRNLQKIWFRTIYHLFVHLGFFNLREMY